MSNFNLKDGNSTLVLYRENIHCYFKGYQFGVPCWTPDKKDALIFKDKKQANNFAKAYKAKAIN